MLVKAISMRILTFDLFKPIFIKLLIVIAVSQFYCNNAETTKEHLENKDSSVYNEAVPDKIFLIHGTPILTTMFCCYRIL